MQVRLNVLLATGLLAVAQAACGAELITADEALRSQNSEVFMSVQSTAPDPLAPVISFADSGAPDKPLKSPFTMEIFFKTQPGTALDFSSFKAFYGTFKIDITERLLKGATKTMAGLKLANVEVPIGRHKILLRINDSQGRTAEKELAFEVE